MMRRIRDALLRAGPWSLLLALLIGMVGCQSAYYSALE